jgi:hypothetical protein
MCEGGSGVSLRAVEVLAATVLLSLTRVCWE